MMERKRKVLICITKSNWGGAQKYVYDIATNIPRDRFDVGVVAGPGELLDRLGAAGIRTIPLAGSQRDINLFKVFSVGIRLIRLFRKEKPDVVHLNSAQMAGSGALAARIAGVKRIVFTGHGWAFNEDRPALQKMLIRFFHILTVLLCHVTVAVSQTTKDQIGAPWNKKMIVIRNGLRPVEFLTHDAARESLLETLAAAYPTAPEALAGKTWIGTISELHKTKGINFAIEAIAKVPDAAFIVIGDGGEKRNLASFIEKTGVGDRVFLAGRIPEASRYLAAFDIATLTSITEAFPYFLLEAGAAGLPVIATNVGGIPEIVQNDENGVLIRAKSANEIEHAIRYLLDHPEKMKSFGVTLREKVHNTFTIEDMVRKTLALYETS
ncbi:MAG: glycosyltransferase [Patescibacteria group bacterium]|nr:glycosyltransferase [Patescibacteria group bacterium]